VEIQAEKKTETSISDQQGSLPRRLGLISAIAVLIGSTIGTGIFRSPGGATGIAARVPDETLYLAMWVIGGFFTLCGALTLAELAGAFPQTGGVYVYLREGWGRLAAFLFGWTQLVVIRASALGAIATVFAEYLLRFLNAENPQTVRYVAAASILLVAIFNLYDISLGALVQNLTTGAKYLALVLLVLAAFIIGANFPAPPRLEAPPAENPLSFGLVGLAFISMLWAYDGWADLTYVSGEIRRPERSLPIALIFGTIAVIAIYLLANVAYLHLFNISQIPKSELIAADTAYRIFGSMGEKLIAVAVMISAFGTLNGSMMTGSRIIFAMADDRLFFRKIAEVHPRFKTPYVSITLVTILAMIFVMMSNFKDLSDMFVLGVWPFYVGGVAAVYALRRKRPDIARPYKTLGYPVTPALFILAVLILLGNALYQDINYYSELLSNGSSSSAQSGALLVFGIILSGIPAYFLWRKFSEKER
jgi:amino acid transporter